MFIYGFFFSIRLNNLKESEAGFYTCEVMNGFQTVTSTGFVRVKNPGILKKQFQFFQWFICILVGIDHIDLNDDS